MASNDYLAIVNFVKAVSEGFTPHDWDRALKKVATRLINVYHVEPVDIIAAMCLFEKGKARYARILLKRAYNDLYKIGKSRGWI